MDKEAEIGLIGLAVMGQNLALNIHDHGYKISVYNRTTSKVSDFINGAAEGTGIIPTYSIEEFIGSLKRPRRILLMVKAGSAVDESIAHISPFLEPGDIIIDGGNSLFTDTDRRCKELEAKGLLYIGAGISGGEEGARNGPSIMPGGHFKAWDSVKDIFQSIAAKVEDGSPCCEWVGEGGSGHYVKMIHNGIEYGDMQLISEVYDLLRRALDLDAKQLHELFKQWNSEELSSYLVEITSHIFATNDTDGKPLVEKILDVAGQKGTGKWTVINSLDLGMPLTLISEAVFARCLSALKDERVEASKLLKGPSSQYKGDKKQFIESVKQGLYASKIISYAQGFMLMRQAAAEYGWNLNFGDIALMWRGGCIIRSLFLGKIKDAYTRHPELKSLLLDEYFLQELNTNQSGWRTVVSAAAELGIPAPCFSSALSFYDGYRSARLPTNLLQAQRDYFGAHTYERIDTPRNQYHHTNWTGTGGNVSSTSYNA